MGRVTVRRRCRPRTLDVEVSGGSGRTTVTVRGDLDMASSDVLMLILDEALGLGRAEIALELADATLTDTAALGILAWLERRAERSGARMLLTSPSPSLLEMLDHAHLSRSFAIG